MWSAIFVFFKIDGYIANFVQISLKESLTALSGTILTYIYNEILNGAKHRKKFVNGAAVNG